MTDAELYQEIMRRDKVENISAIQPPTFQELGSTNVGRLAVLRSIIASETYWQVGIGDPSYNPASVRMEP